ncbi:DUF5916 domain-containing protein [Flavobacterium restrictum]|uniref:Carbohydrate binding family 9 domain-containing protein n=1 Tax=Flavobacterium restrictum TaxID=2594428 RepID=A0A553E3Q3_9FLAO|nr:DUF5916 domain-containing protein [Flavobacterium restrictum]TRX39666.1 carbohydrate binding family 9 domain-containing protein [Flavobacterium restrictum]
MTKYCCFFSILLAFSSHYAFSQKKILLAKSTTENITIDGKINEPVWETASVASDFVMFEPDNGKPISSDKKTEVRILYDNNAIYIAATLYDNEPDKIQKEITNRDVFGVSDHFSVAINGFNDGQQDFRFYVSAAGVQMDCLATEDNEDFSWDAIWDSHVALTSFGWVVEMKIPYAALRFSNAKKQTWGLNCTREIKRDVQTYTWNRVDTKIGAVITQAGILEGIENIQPPTRLFFIPYTSSYYQQSDLGSEVTFKAGLDLKYGINESFTLDAILVPDFGQTKFDNAILNLEPFEQQLEENRPFFTEGTDLFSKGNLFYSRRIGGAPTTDPDLGANEEITNYPSSVDLLNAVKVSGRTEKGLGIGFLNAVTEKTFATITNTQTGETRKEVIAPLTNYNVLVFDQRFNQNSSVTFVNTNTTRNGGFRDANVSALVFDLNTKANTYNLSGDFKYSAINDIESTNGFKTALNFKKTSGRYRYLFSGKYISKNYDVNDLGIIFYTNYHSGLANASYRILNPNHVFNTFKVEQELNVEVQNTFGKLQEAWYKTVIKATTLNNDYFEFALVMNPIETYDFYEPRAADRYVYIPKRVSSYFGFELNRNNPFTFDLTLSAAKFEEQGRFNYGFYASPKYRFNDKFSLAYAVDYLHKRNDRGWVDEDETGIIFAERNREYIQNDFTGKYALNNKMTLNLTARYYWSYANNHQFLTLQNDGHLVQNTVYDQNKNRNFNSWNFDLSYSWWFAPGSEISFLYRNFAQERTNQVETNLGNNINNVFKNNLTNIVSVSLRYFIDYNVVKNKF